MPTISGNIQNGSISSELQNILREAQKIAQSMGDLYITEEHLFLGILSK